MRALVHEKVRVSFLLRATSCVHLRKVLVGTFGVLLRCMHFIRIIMLLLGRAYRGWSRRIMVEAGATVMHVVAATVTALLRVPARVTAHLLTRGCLLYETL